MKKPPLAIVSKYLASVAFACTLGSPVLHADSLYWDAPGGGDLHDASHWLPQASPGSGDFLYFDKAGDYTITSSADLSIDWFELRGASGKVTLDLNGYTLKIGATGISPLLVNQNGLFQNGRIEGTLQLGSAQSGKTFEMTGSTTTMVGSGAHIGRTSVTTAASNNDWTISGGASYQSTANAIIIGSNTSQAAANGNTLTVTGTGSSVTSTAGIIVGNLTSATSGAEAKNNKLIIDDGATATIGSLILGRRSTGSLTTASGNTVSVGGTGTGSKLVVEGVINAGGGGGANVIHVLAGGLVEAKSGGTTLEGRAGNALNVQGGTYDATGQTITARTGTQIALRSNGVLSAGSIVLVGTAQFGYANAAAAAFSSGALHVGSLNASEATYRFTIGSNTGSDKATYEMTGDGLHQFNSGLTISTNGRLYGTGTVSTGTTTVINQGTIGSLDSVGHISLTGNLTSQSTSVYEFLLSGKDSYSRIQTTGSIGFDGTLKISLSGDFAPVAGTIFDLFDFTATSGTFTNLQLGELGDGLTWDVSRLYTDGVVTVIPENRTVSLVLIGLGVLVFVKVRPSL